MQTRAYWCNLIRTRPCRQPLTVGAHCHKTLCRDHNKAEGIKTEPRVSPQRKSTHFLWSTTHLCPAPPASIPYPPFWSVLLLPLCCARRRVYHAAARAKNLGLSTEPCFSPLLSSNEEVPHVVYKRPSPTARRMAHARYFCFAGNLWCSS